MALWCSISLTPRPKNLQSLSREGHAFVSVASEWKVQDGHKKHNNLSWYLNTRYIHAYSVLTKGTWTTMPRSLCLNPSLSLPVSLFLSLSFSFSFSFLLSLLLSHTLFKLRNQVNLTQIWATSAKQKWRGGIVFEIANQMFHLRGVLVPKTKSTINDNMRVVLYGQNEKNQSGRHFICFLSRMGQWGGGVASIRQREIFMSWAGGFNWGLKSPPPKSHMHCILVMLLRWGGDTRDYGKGLWKGSVDTLAKEERR